MTEHHDSPRKIRSVQSSLSILEALRELDGATVSELSKQVDLSVGTIHTHLATLSDEGYVVKENNTYRLGTQFIVLGEYVRNHSTLYRAGKEEVDRLANETGECIHLILEQDGWEISLYEEFGSKAAGKELYIKNREARRQNLHATASGKAILSQMDDGRVREIIDNGLPQLTENTIVDAQTLLEELETIRERGFAVNDEEEVVGTRAVAAPIQNSKGTVLGAISLSAPSSRLRDDTFRAEIPEQITESANVIELNIQASSIGL